MKVKDTTRKQPARFKYEQVCRSLMEMIASGKYHPGERIPSEQELAAAFGCNYHTIRRSMGILEQERLVERRAGAGTFVLGPEDRQNGRETRRHRAMVSTVLGVLCPMNMGAFAAEFLQHLHEQSRQMGYRLIITTVSDYKDSAVQEAEYLTEQGACAVILPWLPADIISDVYSLVKKTNLPFVLPRPLPGLEQYCYERPDLYGLTDYKITDRIYEYLERLEYGHIAFFGPDLPRYETLEHRLTAYSRLTSRRGRESLIGLVGGDSDGVDTVVRRWEKYKGDLAVMCYDDDHAIRLLMSLHKFDLQIPGDVAVMGFNNTPQSKTSDPPLSTIQFDYDYVARSMIAHALAMAKGTIAQGQGDIRETFIIRESCGGRARMGDRLSDILKEP